MAAGEATTDGSWLARGGLHMLDTMLLDALPRKEGPLWSLQAAIEQVDTISQTNLHKLMGENGQRRVATLKEVLVSIEQGAGNVGVVAEPDLRRLADHVDLVGEHRQPAGLASCNSARGS